MTLEQGTEGNGEPKELSFDEIVDEARKKLAEAASDGGPDPSEPAAEPEEEVKAGEAIPVASTKDNDPLELVIPQDAEGVSEFFKGKKVRELLKSHKHAEAKIQEQGREITRLMTEAAAKEAAGGVLERLLGKKEEPAPEKQALPDPILEREEFAEAIRKQNEESTRQILSQKEKEEEERKEAEAVLVRNFTLAMSEIDKFRSTLPEMDDKSFDGLAKALIREVKENPDSYPDGLVSSESYSLAFRTITGGLVPKPEPRTVEPENHLPQGGAIQFGRTAPKPNRAVNEVPSLRREQEDIVNSIANTILSAAGVGGDDFESARAEIANEAARLINRKAM